MKKMGENSMNYEKIIVELLGRIQVLEEQMAKLLEEKNMKEYKLLCPTF